MERLDQNTFISIISESRYPCIWHSTSFVFPGFRLTFEVPTKFAVFLSKPTAEFAQQNRTVVSVTPPVPLFVTLANKYADRPKTGAKKFIYRRTDF
jgi:hypothetical protein